MGRLFGTDGVRGIANSELTGSLAYKLGQVGAYVLTKKSNHKPKILIGRDTRVSGDMLEAALAAGICCVGVDVIILGVVPTPAIAYLTRHYNADAGVVISASHNPMEYNGIKFFDSEGYKLSDEIENEIEEIILNNSMEIDMPIGNDIGKISYNTAAVNDYIYFAKSTISTDLKGLKIAIDCANGALYIVAQKVLEDLGATVFVINNTPNGCNINQNCGSTHMEQLKKFVLEMGADIGLAFDGDADRVLAVDETGEIVDGDKIIAIIAKEMSKHGKLNDNTIVTTVMSNLGLFLMAEENGIVVKQTSVGDRYVLEEMVKNNYTIGGEQSGHIIMLKYNTTGDGLVSGLQLLSVIKSNDKSLSQLATIMKVFPQVLVNAKVKNENKNAYLDDEEITSVILKMQQNFNGEGRVLIRPSGTEPLVRVMIEGRDIEKITSSANELAKLIELKYN